MTCRHAAAAAAPPPSSSTSNVFSEQGMWMTPGAEDKVLRLYCSKILKTETLSAQVKSVKTIRDYYIFLNRKYAIPSLSVLRVEEDVKGKLIQYHMH